MISTIAQVSIKQRSCLLQSNNQQIKTLAQRRNSKQETKSGHCNQVFHIWNMKLSLNKGSTEKVKKQRKIYPQLFFKRMACYHISLYIPMENQTHIGKIFIYKLTFQIKLNLFSVEIQFHFK